MILDKEQYLTPTAGQLFDAADTASEYGSRCLDMLSTGDNYLTGAPVTAHAIVKTADVDNVTSLTMDDGGGPVTTPITSDANQLPTIGSQAVS